MLRHALLITAKDLLQRVRDRTVLFVGFLVPLALAAVFNVTFGGGDTTTFVPRYGLVVADDAGAAAQGLEDTLTRLGAQGVVTLSRPATLAGARAQLEAGDLDGLFVVPSGFSAAVERGGSPSLDVLGTDDAPLSHAIATSIARGYAASVARAQLAVATTAAVGQAETDAVVAAVAAAANASLTLGTGEVAAEQLDQTTYLAAGMAVFFLFFTVQFGVLSLLQERHDGTLPRLYASPIARWTVPLAKTVTSAALGLLSLTTLLVSTALLLGAEWGAPAGVAVLVVCAVLAATSITAAIGAAARTPEQANTAQSVVAVLLGALGGVFFDVTQGSEILAQLSLLTPHQWFLRGLGAIRADGTVGALESSAALLGFAAVGLAIAYVLSRRQARA